MVPSPKVSPTSGGGTIYHLGANSKLPLNVEGTYLIYYHPSVTPTPGTVHQGTRIFKFTIDHTPPVVSLLPQNLLLGAKPSPANSSGIVLVRPGRFRIGALDRLSGVDSVSYQLDAHQLDAYQLFSSDWTPYSDDISYRRTLTVPDAGLHTISIRATDVASNTTVSDPITFEVVDTTPSPSPSPSTPPSSTPTPHPLRLPRRLCSASRQSWTRATSSRPPAR